MPTYIRNPDREITIALYRARGEASQSEDVEELLREANLKMTLVRQNPITDDVWHFVLDLVRNHGDHAVTAAALLGFVKLWLQQRKNRQIEIHRGKLKLKVRSVSDLGKTLDALHRYDELTLSLHRRQSRWSTKSPRKKRSR